VHSRVTVATALDLATSGLGASEIARRLGIPRSTVRGWLGGAIPVRRLDDCHRCRADRDLSALPGEYVYLLGLYLGDGCISSHSRGVYRLRIVLDEKYPGIIRAASGAIETVRDGGSPGAAPARQLRRGVRVLAALAVPVPPTRSRQEARAPDRARALAGGIESEVARTAAARADRLGWVQIPEHGQALVLAAIFVRQPLRRDPRDLLPGLRPHRGPVDRVRPAHDLRVAQSGCRHPRPVHRTEALISGRRVRLSGGRAGMPAPPRADRAPAGDRRASPGLDRRTTRRIGWRAALGRALTRPYNRGVAAGANRHMPAVGGRQMQPEIRLSDVRSPVVVAGPAPPNGWSLVVAGPVRDCRRLPAGDREVRDLGQPVSRHPGQDLQPATAARHLLGAAEFPEALTLRKPAIRGPP
jgi:hypothetical protein